MRFFDFLGYATITLAFVLVLSVLILIWQAILR